MTIHLLFLVACLTVLPALGDNRAEKIQAILQGADKLQIIEIQLEDRTTVTFELKDKDAIQTLVSSLSFKKESPGYCACMGDYLITFFNGDKKLASLTYHHGTSLRWKNWDGDSDFTPESQKAWRTWFKKHGEPRFQEAYEAGIAYQKRQAATRKAFLSAFPPPARKIIEGYGPALEKYYQTHPNEPFDYFNERPVDIAEREKLIASLPNRQDVATAIAKSLGNLSLRGGSWSFADFEVQFVLKVAEALDSDDYQKALTSSDPATLLGLGRLFCYGDLSQKVPDVECGPLLAKLIENVTLHDKGGNASLLVGWLDRYRSPEITRILERIALGKLQFPQSQINPSLSLSFPHLACLLLSKTDSPRLQECLDKVSTLKHEYPDDPLALLIAKANRDPKIPLPDNIFDSESSPICRHALAILEKQRTRKALDLIITKATKHQWADIRENAVLTIERMTRKKWFKDQKNERAEWHAADIRKWWQAENATFQFPK